SADAARPFASAAALLDRALHSQGSVAARSPLSGVTGPARQPLWWRAVTQTHSGGNAMLSPRRLRHLSAAAAILMMTGLTACSTGPEPEPAPEPTTTDEVAVAPEDCILGTWLFD